MTSTINYAFIIKPKWIDDTYIDDNEIGLSNQQINLVSGNINIDTTYTWEDGTNVTLNFHNDFLKGNGIKNISKQIDIVAGGDFGYLSSLSVDMVNLTASNNPLHKYILSSGDKILLNGGVLESYIIIDKVFYSIGIFRIDDVNFSDEVLTYKCSDIHKNKDNIIKNTVYGYVKHLSLIEAANDVEEDIDNTIETFAVLRIKPVSHNKMIGQTNIKKFDDDPDLDSELIENNSMSIVYPSDDGMFELWISNKDDIARKTIAQSQYIRFVGDGLSNENIYKIDLNNVVYSTYNDDGENVPIAKIKLTDENPLIHLYQQYGLFKKYETNLGTSDDYYKCLSIFSGVNVEFKTIGISINESLLNQINNIDKIFDADGNEIPIDQLIDVNGNLYIPANVLALNSYHIENNNIKYSLEDNIDTINLNDISTPYNGQINYPFNSNDLKRYSLFKMNIKDYNIDIDNYDSIYLGIKIKNGYDKVHIQSGLTRLQNYKNVGETDPDCHPIQQDGFDLMMWNNRVADNNQVARWCDYDWDYLSNYGEISYVDGDFGKVEYPDLGDNPNMLVDMLGYDSYKFDIYSTIDDPFYGPILISDVDGTTCGGTYIQKELYINKPIIYLGGENSTLNVKNINENSSGYWNISDVEELIDGYMDFTIPNVTNIPNSISDIDLTDYLKISKGIDIFIPEVTYVNTGGTSTVIENDVFDSKITTKDKYKPNIKEILGTSNTLIISGYRYLEKDITYAYYGIRMSHHQAADYYNCYNIGSDFDGDPHKGKFVRTVSSGRVGLLNAFMDFYLIAETVINPYEGDEIYVDYHDSMTNNFDEMLSAIVDVPNAISYKPNWSAGGYVKEEQRYKIVTDMCKEGFIAGWSDRFGNTKFKPVGSEYWDLSTAHDHNTSKLIKNSIKKFKQTPSSKVYNEFDIKFNKDYLENKYLSEISINNIDEDEFPPENLIDGGTPITDYYPLTSDLNIHIYTPLSGFVCFLTGEDYTVSIDKDCSWNTIPTGTYIHGIDNNGEYFIANIYDWCGCNNRTSYLTYYSGQLPSNGNSLTISISPTKLFVVNSLDETLLWKQYVVGINDYDIAKRFWTKAKESYLTTGIINKLPSDRSELKFHVSKVFYDSYDYETFLDDDWAIEYIDKSLDWTTKQKYYVNYSLPISPETIKYDLMDDVKFSDVIITPELNEYGKGWIIKYKVNVVKNTIDITVLFEPGFLKTPRIPIVDCDIIESEFNIEEIIEDKYNVDEIIEGEC